MLIPSARLHNKRSSERSFLAIKHMLAPHSAWHGFTAQGAEPTTEGVIDKPNTSYVQSRKMSIKVARHEIRI